MGFDLKKLNFFTLETSKNHLFRNFLRNERVRIKKPSLSISMRFFEKMWPFCKDFTFTCVPSDYEMIECTFTGCDLNEVCLLDQERKG